jgi:hypothetical protein
VKIISRALLILLVISWLPACAKKEKVIKGTCQGVYDMSHAMHEMEHPDGPVPLDREHPSYDQYEREREEMLEGDDKKPE